jgi:uncharacterized lipoprotein
MLSSPWRVILAIFVALLAGCSRSGGGGSSSDYSLSNYSPKVAPAR